VAYVEPARSLAPIYLGQRGGDTHRLCKALVAGLPGEIALRELDVVRRAMGWPEECFQIRQLPDDQGPGNAVLVELGGEHVTEVFAAFGSRGTRAEAVAESALQQAKAYLVAGAPVGPHLAAQILVLLALSGGGSFVTAALSHTLAAQIEIARAFLGVSVEAAELGRNRCRVEVAKQRDPS
jgi:RNA 3'-terminal phosphate cyclase (ATP)